MGDRYETDLSSRDALAQAKASALNHGGIQVASDVLPLLHAKVTVGVLLPGNVEMDLTGSVVNHVPASNAFFVLLDDGPTFDAFEEAMGIALEASEDIGLVHGDGPIHPG